jgi:hypothetical protein
MLLILLVEQLQVLILMLVLLHYCCIARGGTGASLSLGAAGSVFLSNGSQVVFDNGLVLVILMLML